MPNLPDIPAGPVEMLLFTGLAFAAIAGAITVILASDPFYSALALIVNFVALGTLYLMLHAPFVAIAQVIVYAGAVVVLFLFVIAFLGDRRELIGGEHKSRVLSIAGAVAGCALLVGLAAVGLTAGYPEVASIATNDTAFPYGSVGAIGQAFLTTFLLEFEATSVVLLVACIGGIVLGLTGRERHDRLRRTLNTTSADQHKRQTRELRRAESARLIAEARNNDTVDG